MVNKMVIELVMLLGSYLVLMLESSKVSKLVYSKEMLKVGHWAI